jgi:beta-glucosidase
MPSRRSFLAAAGAFAATGCSTFGGSQLPYRNEKLAFEKRVEDLLGRMSPADKLELLRRMSSTTRRAARGLSPVPARLEIPQVGIARVSLSGLGLAATWNPDLAALEGQMAAREALARGNAQILGPEVAAYGEDPWLASRMTVGCIGGIQGQGVIATASRLPPEQGAGDERTLQEMILPAFEAAVEEAGVWSVLAHPDDPRLLNDVVRGKWGFKGFPVYDSGAPEDPAESPDEAVRPILRAMFASGLFDGKRDTAAGMSTAPREGVRPAIASQGIVLLRNEGGALPIAKSRVRTLAVIGRDERSIRERAGGAFQVAYAAGGQEAVDLARRSDCTIVFAGGRNAVPDALVRAGKCVVVVLDGNSLPVVSALDSAAAMVMEWAPGPAITAVLFGDSNPCGKLPVTIPRSPGQASAAGGLYTGYRFFDRRHLTPLFPFGHGLSYTEFAWSELRIYPNTPRYGQLIEVMFRLKNTGSRAGAEVVQVYVHEVKAAVDRPVQELKGFRRVELQPGETKDVMISLDRRAVSFYDPVVKEWASEPGQFDVMVGSSSRDIRLKGGFELFR